MSKTKNLTSNLWKPAITVPDIELSNAGFTISGKKKFCQTIQDFSNQVFEKSVLFGEAEKEDGLQREITHDHVKTASANVVKWFAQKSLSQWIIAGMVAEYVLTACSGIGAWNLDKQWGIPVFVLSIVVVGILIVLRLIKTSRV